MEWTDLDDMNLFDTYMQYLVGEKAASPNTSAAYGRDLVDYLEFLEAEPPSYEEALAADHLTVRRYLMDLQKRGFSKTSMARKMSSLRSFYRFLVREELIEDNPLTLVSSPKENKKLPKFIHYEDLEGIFLLPDNSPAGLRDCAILEVLYGGGLRVSELCALTLPHYLKSIHSLRVMGKGQKERLIPLGSRAVAALDGYLQRGRPALVKDEEIESIFLNQRNGHGLTRRAIQDIINKYVERMATNLKISPHMLRHSYATHMLENGADIRIIQELLGHSRLSTTQIYTHITKSHMKEVYNHAHPRS
ncbi:MAG: tyrosine recombinase [Bacillota bacterium]|nr:tyrosine recombinase [Bacillota bacterium]